MIRLEGVTKTYPGVKRDITPLSNISLSVAAEERVVLLGKSGSGKTTFLNLVAGIDEVTRGKIRINGRELTSMADTERTLYRREHIGFIFQFYNLFPTLTVRENLMLPLELLGRPSGDLVRRYLEEVDVADREDDYPENLSGGEQQRIAIVRALIKDPKIILADEPTGNLDYKTSEKILNLLHALSVKYHKTLILATHSRSAFRISTRVLRLSDGAILEEGTGL